MGVSGGGKWGKGGGKWGEKGEGSGGKDGEECLPLCPPLNKGSCQFLAKECAQYLLVKVWLGTFVN